MISEISVFSVFDGTLAVMDLWCHPSDSSRVSNQRRQMIGLHQALHVWLLTKWSYVT